MHANGHQHASILFASHPDPMLLIDGDGLCLDVNASFATSFGLMYEQVKGKNIATLLDWMDWQTTWFSALQGTSAQEAQFRQTDGSVRWAKLLFLPDKTSEGTVQAWYVGLSDITEQKRFQQHCHDRIRYLEIIESNTSDFISILDAQGFIRYASRSYDSIFGRPHTDIIGKHAFELVHPDDVPFLQARLVEIFSGTIYQPPVEFRYLHGHGHWIYTEVRATPIVRNGSITDVVVFSREIHHRKQQEQVIRHLAYHDYLTGLPNRLSLRERLENVLAAAEPGYQLGLLLIDLDGFKQVNDTLGHTAGDEFLRLMAARLAEVTPAHGFLARMGGDEFVILMSPTADSHAMTVMADTILQTISMPCAVGDASFSLTASIGISVYPGDGSTAEELIRTADIALYASKNRGKNSYTEHQSL